MKKLYFEGNVINVYSEDLQTLQSSLADELKYLVNAIAGGSK